MNTASGASLIHAIANDRPEQALYAAVIHRALIDAQGGDTDAVAWLASGECHWYVTQITPADMQPDLIQKTLIDVAGR
jgi:hypothetical protein